MDNFGTYHIYICKNTHHLLQSLIPCFSWSEPGQSYSLTSPKSDLHQTPLVLNVIASNGMILKRWWAWVIQHHFKSQKLVKTMFQDQIMSINVLKTMSIAAPKTWFPHQIMNINVPFYMPSYAITSTSQERCGLPHPEARRHPSAPLVLGKRRRSPGAAVAAGAGAAEGGVREGGSLWGDGHGDWAMAWAGCGKDIYIYTYIYSIQICIKIAIETWETLGNLDGNKWEKLGVGMIGWVSRCIWASFDSMIWEDGMGNPNSHLMPLKVGNYDKLWQNIGMNMMYNIYIYIYIYIYTFDVNLHWKLPSFSWRNLEWRQNLGESHRISVILLVQSRSIRYRIVLWLCYIRFCEGYAFPAILSSCWGQKMPKASHKTLRRWPKTSVAVHTSTKTTSPSSMRWLWATSLRAESCVWRKRWVKTMDELATGKVIKRGWLWKSGKSL